MPYTSPLTDRLANIVRETPLAACLRELESRPEPPPLVPQPDSPWRQSLSRTLSGLTPGVLCGHAIKDADAAEAVKAGLFLWNDDLDSSHAIAQNLHTPTGSYWHGLMHRREPDYSNSKYWFRLMGDHAIFPDLKAIAVAIAEANRETALATTIGAAYEWEPFRFIDWCEAAARKPDAAPFLRQVQLDEFRLLLLYTYAQAIGLPYPGLG